MNTYKLYTEGYLWPGVIAIKYFTITVGLAPHTVARERLAAFPPGQTDPPHFERACAAARRCSVGRHDGRDDLNGVIYDDSMTKVTTSGHQASKGGFSSFFYKGREGCAYSPIGLCHQNNRLLQKFGEGEKEGTTEKGEILMHC